MPSPVATMRPTSVATRLASKSFRRSLMTSEISLVLIPTLLFLLGGVRQSASQLLQSGGEGGVDQVIAVLDLEAADDPAVDDRLDADLRTQLFRQLIGHLAPLLGAELDRARHDRVDLARRLIGQALELVGDPGRLADPSGL